MSTTRSSDAPCPAVVAVAPFGMRKWESSAFRLCALLALLVAPYSRAEQPVAVVDVLVVYTPQARLGAGGGSAIEAQISLAAAEANFVFQNSKAKVRLRLAHAAEIAYTESGFLANDLNRLLLANDGFLD